ncbi:MAG: anthranilate synthase component [Bacilli bacterium]|nr:anthranilate synthase component [Bacilli bacterium]
MSSPLTVRTEHRIYPRMCEAFDVYRELTARCGMQSAFLLDSVSDVKNPNCTSYIGFRPLLGVTCKNDNFNLYGNDTICTQVADYLEQYAIKRSKFKNVSVLLDTIRESFTLHAEDEHPPYSFGYLGFFGYDAVRYYEDIPCSTQDDRNIDDVHLQIHQVILHFDENHIHVYVNRLEGAEPFDLTEIEQLLHPYEIPSFDGYDPALLRVEEDVPREEFIRRVEQAKHYISEGDIFQVLLSKRDRVIGEIDPLQIYYRLKKVNPSPYMFFVDYGDYQLFGASPEVQVRLDAGKVQMRPIAGTTKGKGKTQAENDRLVADLLADEKERAEHLMLVDLCRNDLGRIAKPGTVHVPQLMVIEEYSHVFHIVSLVEAEVADEVSRFDVFLSSFPAGTLSGAPKIRAMQIIDEFETIHRGPYGGVLGFFDFLGNMNTAIVIRTIVHQNGVCYFQAGAGIVADSIPEQEWEECNHKLRVLQSTVLNPD